MKPRILIDSDGVVCDLERGWLQWYRARYNGAMTAERMFRNWHVADNVPEGEAVYDCFDEPGFFRNLQAYPGAVVGLRRLHEQADVVIVTNAGGRPAAMQGKAEWFRHHCPFLDMEKQFVVAANKWDYRADAIVEDKLGTIQKFLNERLAAGNFNYPPVGFFMRRMHDRVTLVDSHRIVEVQTLQQVFAYMLPYERVGEAGVLMPCWQNQQQPQQL